MAVELKAPVSIYALVDKADLKEPGGVMVDSHITLLYAPGKKISRETTMSDIETILSPEGYPFSRLINEMKEANPYEASDLFELDCFENDDADYLILRLKESADIFKPLNLINKALGKKYGAPENYKYTPHITLATLLPGTGKKYLEAANIKAAVSYTDIAFEDIVLSYGMTGEIEDREKYNLTIFHAVDRYFREANLQKDIDELKKSE